MFGEQKKEKILAYLAELNPAALGTGKPAFLEFPNQNMCHYIPLYS